MTPLSEVATVTQRLAVLLAAGVAPASAWTYVGVQVDAARVAESLVETTAHRPELEAQAWRGLAAAWAIATDAGAPLAPTLRDYATALRSLAHSQREAEVALTGPIATARLVMVLPVIGILFGMALGFDTVGTLFGSPPGWACLIVGAVLMLAANRWNHRLVTAAQPGEATPGIECDLMAIAVSGGGSLDRARAALDQTVARFHLVARADRIDGVLDLSRRAGVPAAELLRGEADEARRSAAADAQAKAAALSVSLMLPLGLCVLPAFMVLGVFPLLIAVISSTAAGF
ncbi:hypothetical protein BH10ACT7_BH10ACT7_06470 [soil metagenome]